MQYHRVVLPLSAIGLLAGFSGASTLLILGSATTTTTVAGGSSADVRTLGPTGSYQGLYRITWAEDADIPCYFKVQTRHLNTNNTQSEEANLGGASCSATSRSERSAGFNTPALFVNGIRVCRNNQRIKGIEVYYGQVRSDGTVFATTTTDAGVQPKCDYDGSGSWGAARYCPNNQIATQIKIHHQADNPPGAGSNVKQAAIGIALVCRPVEIKS